MNTATRKWMCVCVFKTESRENGSVCFSTLPSPRLLPPQRSAASFSQHCVLLVDSGWWMGGGRKSVREYSLLRLFGLPARVSLLLLVVMCYFFVVSLVLCEDFIYFLCFFLSWWFISVQKRFIFFGSFFMVIFRRIQCISESWWKSIELDAYLVLNISIYLFKVYLKTNCSK